MLNALVRKVDLIQVKVAKKGGEGPKTIWIDVLNKDAIYIWIE